MIACRATAAAPWMTGVRPAAPCSGPPHRAPARRTPAEAYAARPKATASGIPLIDGHLRVRHDKIASTES
jgi:hypothetical protein